MVRTVSLTRRFGELVAVDHLNLDIKPGEIFGLVGPDGAGKTTTLRLLCGLMDPSEGQVEIGGRDVLRGLDAIKDQIGYMAQRFGLYLDLTVEENLFFYADLFGISRAERDALMRQLLRMTRMEPFRGRPAGKLSGGMKQKLALMCTLFHHPRVLFLDEPTNGVDPVSRRDFWAILYQLVKEGIFRALIELNIGHLAVFIDGNDHLSKQTRNTGIFQVAAIGELGVLVGGRTLRNLANRPVIVLRHQVLFT